MINASALFQELQRTQQSLFGDYQQQIKYAQKLWKQVIACKVTYQMLKGQGCLLTICWHDVFGVTYSCNSFFTYQIIAIDGSQIYPDRHEGIRIALINVGGIWLLYDQKSRAQFFCCPHVFFQEHEQEVGTVGLVDAQRHAYELETGAEQALFYTSDSDCPLYMFFDGALMFWDLKEKEDICTRYFDQYCDFIQKLHERKIPCAWYTSLPKSRDLVRVLESFAVSQNTPNVCLKNIGDADLLCDWLKLHERTAVFEITSDFAQKYPEALRPHFFYVHSGAEIARVEIPAYCAQDDEMVNALAGVVIDQCVKGDGYPLSLAEAHEHVVIKQQDRLLFQKLVCYFANQHHMPVIHSRKLIKKHSLVL